MNRSVSVISFSRCLLLVYRKAIDFCKLILHAAILLKLLIVSRLLLVKISDLSHIISFHLQRGIT